MGRSYGRAMSLASGTKTLCITDLAIAYLEPGSYQFSIEVSYSRSPGFAWTTNPSASADHPGTCDFSSDLPILAGSGWDLSAGN